MMGVWVAINDERLTTDDGSPTTVTKTKRPPWQGVASSFRENSSNGAKIRQNFLAKSYEPKKGGVKGFLGNKYLWIQQLRK
jgi:hypothetical protein